MFTNKEVYSTSNYKAGYEVNDSKELLFGITGKKKNGYIRIREKQDNNKWGNFTNLYELNKDVKFEDLILVSPEEANGDLAELFSKNKTWYPLKLKEQSNLDTNTYQYTFEYVVALKKDGKTYIYKDEAGKNKVFTQTIQTVQKVKTKN